ncbi:MAG TPA: aldehyde dehydrogenase family protein, partial [Acidimicrobiales bacterium]|nr:aldehyde dehydrogenase family protein [Acidimicrobiales bacterium]
TTRSDFRRSALAYLARRLDENATPEGFLRHAFAMRPGGSEWAEQLDRFEAAVRQRHHVSTRPRQHQDRLGEGGGETRATEETAWHNEDDTDLSVASNRSWAHAVLRARPRPPPAAATLEDVVDVLGRAVAGSFSLGTASSSQRRERLLRSAEALARGRAEAISVMAAETAKTFAEADPEVSEAVDYARWYARGVDLLEHLGEVVESRPLGVVVVASPWNFPYAIPAGGALAALGAGNSVIIKPSPEARATAALLVSQLRQAGFDQEQLQAVPAPDGREGERLITDESVGGIILTGSLATAELFRRSSPKTRLLAETSGKNAIVVAGSADVDQAVSDLVRSAFGHAGQKCSAASLAIVDAAIYDRSTFLRQLRDATESLRVGPATDPATEVGPIVGPFTESLERALTRLEPGESWLVAPRLVDPEARLWSPGVRIGVRPGSWTHTTEWFGPVLGLLRTESLERAIAVQNAVPFGLTAGLQSLDPEDHGRWASAVEAGNLYINRPTTGAIVGRQPFGGWKGSSVGPTAKAGGPNYMLGLRRWRDAVATTPEVARRDYERWWREYFSVPTDLAGLSSESNVLRYLPFLPGVVVRVGDEVPDDEVRKAAAAAEITGTPLSVSSSRPRGPLKASVERGGAVLVVESAASFAARCHGLRAARVRLLGAPEAEVVAAAGRHGLSVLDEPICSHGRLELVRWLREQSISRSLHRYGNVVFDRSAFSS